MCTGVCADVCESVDLLTSSVLRGSTSATYGCFYRGCINWDIAVNINVSPEDVQPLPECRWRTLLSSVPSDKDPTDKGF